MLQRDSQALDDRPLAVELGRQDGIFQSDDRPPPGKIRTKQAKNNPSPRTESGLQRTGGGIVQRGARDDDSYTVVGAAQAVEEREDDNVQALPR
jgi:hypothetical protein